MATLQAPLTPVANQTPAIANVPATTLSGTAWVAQFPTSVAVSDCTGTFKGNLTSFIAALTQAGASVSIAATFRPTERSFLMHWCWSIVNASADPQAIPAMAGVAINWAHTDAQGAYSAVASKAAAQLMVNAYGMQTLGVAPALSSRHNLGLAIDMSIAWAGSLTIANADGTNAVIATSPKTGMNTDLHAVGATYNVIKFVGGASDPPHWSDNGH